MNQSSLDQVWQTVAKKPYKGRTLASWLHLFMILAPQTLDQNAGQFLPAMTKWVVEQYREGRKGGVPIGYLEKFALKDQKMPFFDLLATMVVRILRKRGLHEYDSMPTPTFTKLVEAWDRAKNKR